MSKKTYSQTSRAIYQREYRRKNPLIFRENNRKQAAKNRKKRGYNKKFSAYFKEWYASSPLNAKCHNYRTFIGTLKLVLKRMETTTRRRAWKPEIKQIYENLQSVGWVPDLPKDMCVNHCCSIKIILEFNIEVPRHVVYEKYNIEVITKVENNSFEKRTITKDTVKIARRLEKDYPSYLKGFGKHVEKQIGRVL